MDYSKMDNVSAGYVFAYDAKTGEVLWTHEKIVEVIRGRDDCPARITEAECEHIRREAAAVFRGRDVNALIAPEGFALAENERVSVDPKRRCLVQQPDEPRSLADRFSDFAK